MSEDYNAVTLVTTAGIEKGEIMNMLQVAGQLALRMTRALVQLNDRLPNSLLH